MKKNRRKKRSNFEKIILAILIIILVCLLVYAFKDKFTENNVTNTNSNTTNKIQPSKNTNKTDDEKEEKKEEETKQTTTNTSVEPKKDEKDENKQQMQNNITAKIELVGSDEITLKVGEKYKELGVKATDSNGKDISSQVSIESNVDTSKAGEYMVIYSIGKSMVIRNVTVK